MEIIKPRTLSGFMELLPDKQQRFETMAEILRRTYAEWDLATRLPLMPYGTLYWYCTQHGLFSQPLRRK